MKGILIIKSEDETVKKIINLSVMSSVELLQDTFVVRDINGKSVWHTTSITTQIIKILSIIENGGEVKATIVRPLHQS